MGNVGACRHCPIVANSATTRQMVVFSFDDRAYTAYKAGLLQRIARLIQSSVRLYSYLVLQGGLGGTREAAVIRINRGGLSPAEVEDVERPLSPNSDSRLDISNIESNLILALERYGHFMDEAIAAIDGVKVPPSQ